LEEHSKPLQEQLILTFPGNERRESKDSGSIVLTMIGWVRQSGFGDGRQEVAVFTGCADCEGGMHVDKARFSGETPLVADRDLKQVRMPDPPVPEPKSPTLQDSRAGTESDLGELAALFATHSGGGLSMAASADLALEIVLNEIVEQVCQATSATGAAIVLVREGEMVCHASSGTNAPELGAPLGSESGLTAECIRTRRLQRCDDALADPRADAEASRSLGVRSVMIFPLLRGSELAGLLEVFSSRPAAFGDRDERTLEVLGQRILKNLERASEPLSLSSNAAASEPEPNPAQTPVLQMATANKVEDSGAGSATSVTREKEYREYDDVVLETSERSPRAGFDILNVALGAAVLVCALLLGTLVGIRLGWQRSAHRHAAKPVVAAATPQNPVLQNPASQNAAPQNPVQNVAAQTGGESATNAGSGSESSSAGNAGAADSEKKNVLAPVIASAAGPKDSPVPVGSLLVYENGKEIFRLLPTGGESAPVSAVPGKVQRASAVEPVGTVELARGVAEGSLLRSAEPEYPEAARLRRIQGPVVLEVRIGRDGAIQNVKWVSGRLLLANAAIAAVKQWQFRPHLVQGQPVEMQTKVILNFKLPADRQGHQ
jgi:TonB family protein